MDWLDERQGRIEKKLAKRHLANGQRALYDLSSSYFDCEKCPGADNTLGTQMKSVGEVMSIGRTFCEALQKAARSLEIARDGLVPLVSRVDYRLLAEPKRKRDLGMEAAEVEAPRNLPPPSPEELVRALRAGIPMPVADRLLYVADAMRAGGGPA